MKVANPFVNDDIANKYYVDDAVSNINIDLFRIVEELPTTGEKNVTYLIWNETDQLYKKFIWETNKWLDIGTFTIDLSKYVTREEFEQAITTEAKARESQVEELRQEVIKADNQATLATNKIWGTQQNPKDNKRSVF